jgi:hypothetical protein
MHSYHTHSVTRTLYFPYSTALHRTHSATTTPYSTILLPYSQRYNNTILSVIYYTLAILTASQQHYTFCNLLYSCHTHSVTTTPNFPYSNALLPYSQRHNNTIFSVLYCTLTVLIAPQQHYTFRTLMHSYHAHSATTSPYYPYYTALVICSQRNHNNLVVVVVLVTLYL